MINLTDEQLVEKFSQGQNRAFDVLLSRHQKRLFNYIFFIVKNNDLADDIFQDTFIKAIATIKNGRYNETGKFYGWLTRIAHNLIIDFYRQEKNQRKVLSDDCEYDFFNSQDYAENSVEEEWVIKQTYAKIKQLVEILPESQREVVLMRFYRDMSFKEIAEATDVSINTALGRMRYAILNLRKLADEQNLLVS